MEEKLEKELAAEAEKAETEVKDAEADDTKVSLKLDIIRFYYFS